MGRIMKFAEAYETVRALGACNAVVEFALVPPFKVGYLIAGSR